MSRNLDGMGVPACKHGPFLYHQESATEASLYTCDNQKVMKITVLTERFRNFWLDTINTRSMY